MIERIVIIDHADPVSFYGVNNSNMQLIRNLFSKASYGCQEVQSSKLLAKMPKPLNLKRKFTSLRNIV